MTSFFFLVQPVFTSSAVPRIYGPLQYSRSSARQWDSVRFLKLFICSQMVVPLSMFSFIFINTECAPFCMCMLQECPSVRVCIHSRSACVLRIEDLSVLSVNNSDVCKPYLATNISKQTCFVSPLAAPETRQAKSTILIRAPCFFRLNDTRWHKYMQM